MKQHYETAARVIDPDLAENRYALEALERHKREGMELAVRARTIAMSVIAVLILLIVPWPASTYYCLLILAFVGIGLLQQRYAQVGASRLALALLFCDLALMTIIAAIPNPFLDRLYPVQFQFQFEVHKYFFVLLAVATLAYSWRTIFAVGTWTTVLWISAVIGVWSFSENPPGLSSSAQALFAPYPPVGDFLDPTKIVWDQRVEEVVIFLICACVLGVSARRFNNLLLAQASAERERANLARYFSPNVVDQLSQNDEPLKKISKQDIAVMFVDIVGFTPYAAARAPEQVITTLREFHGLMEAEVFRHQGTLDKYLGDGLMATFGTPMTSPDDATNAWACARAMLATVDGWNAARSATDDEEIKVSIGIHFGPVVLGDIGANRLEFAVIGNTVNVASRLEAMTRTLGVRLAVSEVLLERADLGSERTVGLTRHADQPIRGLETPMTVWALR